MKIGRDGTCGAVRFALTATALVALAGQAAAQDHQPQPGTSIGAGSAPKAHISKPEATGNIQALRNPLDKDGPGAAGGAVTVDDNLIVDLHVNDEELANVLQMLSIQSQRNIVASKNVAATVTANLYGVTFYQALDAILHVNGYGYIERDNFIYVYTLQEIQEIEKTLRKRVKKVMNLNYLNSTDAAEFAKSLLSEGGTIKVNGKVEDFNVGTNPVGAEDFALASTMVIFDYEENVTEIEALLKELDTKPQQVLVEATILQTSLNESNAFGVDFAVIGDINFSDFFKWGGPLKAAEALVGGSKDPSGGGSGSSGGSGSGGSGTNTQGAFPADNKGGAIASTPGNTAGPSTLKLGLVATDVAAFIKILDEVSDTSVLSRPTVLTLNRQPASVLVGRNVGYINTVSTDTSSNTSLATISTGTQLFLRPFISKDGYIRMELKPKVSEPIFRSVTGPNGVPISIPDEITNELTANVMVKDGKTIVLGGLFREGVTANRRQVPGVGDLPIIGAAFRGHDDNTSRSEIIFLITPTVVNDDSLIDQGERATALVDAARSGSREGLLPWSREKRTQQLLIEAERLAAAGENDAALNKIQRCLAMNPMHTEAIALRERLLSNKTYWPTRSLMNEIVRNESGNRQLVFAQKAAEKRAMEAELRMQAEADREEKERVKREAAAAKEQAKREAEEAKAQAKADTEARRQAEIEAKAQARAQAQADAEAEAQARAEAEAQAQRQAELEAAAQFSNAQDSEMNNTWNDSFTNDNQGNWPTSDQPSEMSPSSNDPFSPSASAWPTAGNTFGGSNASPWGDAMVAAASSITSAFGNGPFASPVSLIAREYWTLVGASPEFTGQAFTNVETDSSGAR